MPEAARGHGPPDPLDSRTGRYAVRADLSYGVIAVYVLLLLVVLLVLPSSPVLRSPVFGWALAALIAFFLIRYLSTRYRMDAETLTAFRILGGRTIRLEEIRRIQYASLRDLSPTGFFGSWGYRGRMWSPVIETFDSVQTNSSGILIWAGAHPLFITPKDPDRFIRELSRRVRSWRGRLEVDDGAPGIPTAPAAQVPPG
ncbi:MAG: PH domain-containing protein [Thermoplasmata archaeon]